MLKEWLGEQWNSNTVIIFECDRCGKEFRRLNKVFRKTKERKIYEGKHLCRACCNYITKQTPEYKQNMSNSIKKLYQEHPERAEKISIRYKGKINLGDANCMKRVEIREKISSTRKEIFKNNPTLKKVYSDRTKEAWIAGKFEGARVGQCKWFDYKDTKNIIHKVQGTWELSFIEWLDRNNITFKCHRGRLPYTINGESHSYYPDFWVDSWNSYVDIKAPFFYNTEKFDAIRKSNPGIKVLVLFKEDMLKLGVKL